ncbi:MAG: ABC transporter [Ectothiorhodospiraceae bacterium]|nr:ABC transporter [Ectothiorhodospiraceae bacterium]
MIRVENLSKSFGNTVALDGVSFEIDKGEICGYIGPNGAGKTTTVKILTGMLPPDSGETVVADIDLKEQPEAVKPLYGYIAENGVVYESLTANEYLQFVGRLHGLEEEEIVKRGSLLLSYFGIRNEADTMMTGYSKGMKQKVIITAAMLHQPSLYFFDEPLNGLDAEATLLFKELVRQLAARGKTVLYCSHLLDTVEKLCSRIIVLKEGKIIADGNIDSLKTLTKQQNLDEVFTSLTTSENRLEKTSELLDQLDSV